MKMPKIKMISRNPDEYMRETKRDIHKGNLEYADYFYRTTRGHTDTLNTEYIFKSEVQSNKHSIV